MVVRSLTAGDTPDTIDSAKAATPASAAPAAVTSTPASSAVDLATLSWCIAEIRGALNQTETALDAQRLAEDGDTASLRMARLQLHQVHGALLVVDVPAATVLTEEAEAVLDAVINDSLKLDAAVVNALRAAFAACVEYLDDLLQEQPDQPLYLFPYLQALRKLRGAEREHPADLFFPDLSRRLPATVALPQVSVGAFDPADASDATDARKAFEKGLLKFLREPGKTRGLDYMLAAVGMVERHEPNAASRNFWRITLAFLDALRRGYLDPDVYSKRLLARLNLQLRKSVNEGSAVPDRLLQDTLYALACAKGGLPLVDTVRSVYGLEGVVPGDFMTPRYGRHDSRTIRAARDALNQARIAWDSVSRGHVADAGALVQALTAFQTAVKSLPGTGMHSLASVLVDTGQVLANRHELFEMPVALEAATAILFVDQVLEQGGRAREEQDPQAAELARRLSRALNGGDVGDVPAWLQEQSAAAQDRMTMASFIRETLVSLKAAEQALDGYFRDPAKRDELPGAARQLSQVGGALQMLGYRDAADAARATGETVSAFAEQDDPPSEADCERVAANCGALGFFVEGLQQRHRQTGLFEFDRTTGEFRAQLAQTPKAADVAPTVAAIDHKQHAGDLLASLQQAPADAQVRQQLRGALEQMRDDALLRDDPKLKKQAADAIDLLANDSQEAIEKLSDAMAKMAPAAAPAVAAEPSRAIPEDSEAIDQELLEIFLAEANEVLAAIEEASSASRRAPSDQQFLTTIRRGFHTLKGSSRMVGLNAFGEAGWSLEQVMNLWLSEERAGEPDLYSLIDDARAQMLGWVQRLEADPATRVEPAALIATADHFRETGRYSPVTVEVPPPAEAQEPQAIEPAAVDSSADAAAIEIEAPEETVESGEVAEPIADAQAIDIGEPVADFEAVEIGEPEASLDAVEVSEPEASLDALWIDEPEATFDAIEVSAPEGSLDQLDTIDIGTADALADASAPAIDEAIEVDGAAATDSDSAAPSNADMSMLAGDTAQLAAFDLDEAVRSVIAQQPVTSLPSDANTEAPAASAGEPATIDSSGDESGETALPDLDLSSLAPSVDASALGSSMIESLDEPIELTDRIEVPDALEPLSPTDLAQLGLLPDEAATQSLDEQSFEQIGEDAYGETFDTSLDAFDEDAARASEHVQPVLLDPIERFEPAAVPDSELIELDVLGPLAEPDMAVDASDFCAQMDDIVGSLLSTIPYDPAAEAAEAARLLDRDGATAPAGASGEPASDVRNEKAVDGASKSRHDASQVEPQDEAADDTIVIGDQTLSRTLHGIFLGEADGLMEKLSRDLADWRAEPTRPASAAGARAAHSLAGSAGLVGLQVVRDLAVRLEEALLTQARTGFRLADADFSVMSTALERMQSMIGQFARAGMPTEDVDALDGLALLQLRMLAAQPSIGAAPASAAVVDEDSALAIDVSADAAALEAELAEQAGEPVSQGAEALPAGGERPDARDVAPEDIEGQVPEAEDADALELTPDEQASIAAAIDAAAGALSVAEETAPAVVDELDADLLPIFIEEADDLLPGMGTDLRRWAENPADAARARNLMRALHTVKGSARMAGAMNLGQRVHEMETRIEALTVLPAVPRSMIDELIAEHDQVMSLFEAIKDPGKAAAPVVPAAAAAQAPVASEVSAAPAPAQPPVPTAPAKAAATKAAVPVATPTPDAQSPVDGKPSTQLVRVRADLLDRVVNEAGEASIARSKLDNELSGMRQSLAELTENVNRLRGQLRDIEIQAESQIQAQTRDVDRAFDPLEFDRYTRFQELTRMLAESVSDVATVQQNLARNLDEATQELVRQAQVLRDLQQNLMRVRMVQFGTIADRLFRVARQAAKETGKRVNLDVRGSAVEVDRGVLEKMAGPLEHLVRNAVAHGIEPRELRQANGKAETGEIRVEVRQEGNEIILILADDGGGLDLARIRARAVANGLIGEDATPSDRELRDLIFAPGFSTADKVTELSGRGVGMDVVRVETSALGGRIETDSVPGRGSRFTIHLPLTLAVAQVVLMGAAGARFAVPSSSVEQVLQLKPEALADGYANGHVDWQGNKVPLFYLGALVELQDRSPVAQQYSPVAILRSGSQRIALHVDTLARNQEVVVKNVGPQVSRVHGVTGATVLGNGDIVLIINPVQLAIEAVGPSLDAHSVSVPMIQQIALEMPACVMVVDDSVTVRKVTQRLLGREGYQVLLAKDGVDALRQMQDTVPDVMLVDIEMPRMDGFDLTRAVRADERYAGIPIVMITSRTADKHRNVAFELGVNAYLGKPYSEDELLRLIDDFLQKKGGAKPKLAAH